MKKVFKIAVLVLFLASVMLHAYPSEAARFYKISGVIRGLTGNYKAYVYLHKEGASNWFDPAVYYKKLIIYPDKIKDGRAEYSFLVEEAEYAVAVFEDVNGDGKFNVSGYMSSPLEPYGFYRRYIPIFRFPDFSDCSFTLKRDIMNANVPLMKRIY